MADTKISALSADTTLDATDEAVLNSGGTTKKITGANLMASMPGYEIAYAQITSPVTISATTEGAAQDVVSSGAVTYDGTAVYIEFYAPRVDVGAAAETILVLQDGATALGWIGYFSVGAVTAIQQRTPARLSRKLTPSAGSHTYKITGFRVTVNGTVQAGAGGSAAFMPAYIRVTKA
jgi:PKD repeat protein